MSARKPTDAEVWGPHGLPPQQYPCTKCGDLMPPGCRASKCWTCLSAEIDEVAKR